MMPEIEELLGDFQLSTRWLKTPVRALRPFAEDRSLLEP